MNGIGIASQANTLLEKAAALEPMAEAATVAEDAAEVTVAVEAAVVAEIAAPHLQVEVVVAIVEDAKS